MDARDHLITVHGARHRVRLIGSAGAARPHLVILHEGLGSIPQWRSFPTDLAIRTGLPAVVYDRRSHGGTDPLPAARNARYHAEEAEILDELLTALGIERTVAYGHSDGATIALLHAAAHPDRVATVVSEAGHVVTEEVARAGIRDAVDRFREDPEMREKLERYHGNRADTLFSTWADTWLHPMFDGWSIVGELSTVTAPVLAIQGEHDEYASPEHLQWIADAVGGRAETWLVPGVGHAPHREAPDAVLDRVAEFLDAPGVIG